MSKPEFTPGPWRAERTDGWGGDYCIHAAEDKPIFKAVKPKAYYTDFAPVPGKPDMVILSNKVAAEQGRYVATRETRARLDAEEAANAHLISAAPEMYEALVLMRDALAAVMRSAGFDDLTVSKSLAPANAALAKAEGRS